MYNVFCEFLMRRSKRLLSERRAYAFAALVKVLCDSRLALMHKMQADMRGLADVNIMECAMADHVRWQARIMEDVLRYLEFNDREQSMIEQLPCADDSREISVIFIRDLFPPAKKSAANSDDELKRKLLQELLIVFLSRGVYDARSRCLIEALSGCFGVSDPILYDIEACTSEMLQNHVLKESKKQKHTGKDDDVAGSGERPGSASSSHSSLADDQTEVVETHKSKNRVKRWTMMGLAGVAGGVIIGVTGGLAAPLVGVGLAGLLSSIGIGGTAAFLGSAGGVALITSVFGAAGFGLTSSKMARRVRGVSEFQFVSHRTLDRDELQTSSPTISKSAPDSESLKSRLKFWKRTESEPTSPAADPNSESSQAPFVTISISGWISKKQHTIEPWLCLNQCDTLGNNFSGDHYSLLFETTELIELGSAVENLITSGALTMATTEVLKHTIAASLVAAIAWPAALLNVASILDNPWSIGMDRSRKAGVILAEILLSYPQGHRPVTLVGSSLGARTIFYCLLELAKRAQGFKPKKDATSIEGVSSPFGLVQNVVLLGAAISPSNDDFVKARSVVSGRFVNAYSRSDWILGFLFRASGSGLNVLGLKPALVKMSSKDNLPDSQSSNPAKLIPKKLNAFMEGSVENTYGNMLAVENIDVGDIVDGHTSYADKLIVKEILTRCGLMYEKTEPLDVELSDLSLITKQK